MSSRDVDVVDVVVVGGGLAGLVAARDLQRAGLSTAVFEARDRVGGRLWNRTLSGGAVTDLGGQFVGPAQTRLLALAAELGVDTFRVYDDGDTVVSVAGGDEAELPSLDGFFAELDALARQVPPEAPWTAERADEWDGQTFHTWMCARIPEPAGRDFVRMVIVALFTAEPEELSLLHVLVYIRAAGSLAALTETDGGAQERRFVGGAQTLAVRLAGRLAPGTVRLGAVVHRIRQVDGGVVVDATGERVTARRAVVAVPVALADRIAYEPPLPPHRAQLHQRVAPGATVKVQLVYPTPFWRDRGLNGRVFTDSGYLRVTFDNTPAAGTPGILVGFAEADAARAFTRLSAPDRRAAAVACMVRYFGAEAGEPVEYIETDWSDQEWTRGCFGANFPPGTWTRYGHVLREPWRLIHWAGAETSPVWMNYMEGAVRSGERAAAEVVAAVAAGAALSRVDP